MKNDRSNPGKYAFTTPLTNLEQNRRPQNDAEFLEHYAINGRGFSKDSALIQNEYIPQTAFSTIQKKVHIETPTRPSFPTNSPSMRHKNEAFSDSGHSRI